MIVAKQVADLLGVSTRTEAVSLALQHNLVKGLDS